MNFPEMLVRIFTLVVEASFAATILAVLVFAIERALRKRLSSAWRFAIYLPVLFRLLLPIVPHSPTSILNLPNWIKGFVETERSSPVASPSAQFAPVVVSEIATQVISARPALTPISEKRISRISPIQFFAMLWFSVSVILLLRLAVGAFRLNRRLRGERAASPELADLLENLRVESDTRWRPLVIETSLVQSPCLFGLFRPKLLLPVGFADSLSTSELSHVILHELAHLKRGDLVINCLMAVAQSVHWFNPVVWLLFRRMRLLCELACDRLVLEMRRADLTEAKAYGETLLKLINGFTSRSASSATIGILENEQSAETRLRQIASFVPVGRRGSVVGVFVMCVLVVVGLSNAQSPRIQIPATDTEGASASTAEPLPQESKAKRHAANVETWEREYAIAKQEVDRAQAEVERVRKELRIELPSKSEYEAGLASGAIQNSESEVAEIQQGIQKSKKQLSDVTALLEQLKKLPRNELRKALPTSLQPPDEHLNRLLGDYSAAEQKYAQLSGNFSDEHPEVATAREVLATINRQIEDRIEGILMGLEVRRKTSDYIVRALHEASAEARVAEVERREKYMPYFRAKRSLEESQRVLDAIFMRLLAEKVDAKVPTANRPEPAFE